MCEGLESERLVEDASDSFENVSLTWIQTPKGKVCRNHKAQSAKNGL